MSGIKQPILDIINKLKTLSWPNQSGQSPPLYSSVWNNQFKYLELGQTYNFPLPAALVEIQMPDDYTQLAYGFTESDIVIKIHLIMNQPDAGAGNLDQNLSIFALRDAIIKLLTHFQPTQCSEMMKVREHQDLDHDSLYDYVIDWTCSFIDDTGSTYPANQTTPPTTLELTTGLAPIEVLSVNYGGGNLVVEWKLVDSPQNVNLTLNPGAIAYPVLAASVNDGANTFTQAVSLAPGNYSLTIAGAINGFTTPVFNFTV